ncbi:MAG: methyltransferase domain-containing protein [Pseudomonadota bacterium]|nr:methyltransferase domain-containing protein [Pseudomonadota bacterium]
MSEVIVNRVFAQQLNLALQQMYDKICSCENGLLNPVAIDRGIRLLENLNYPQNLIEKLPPGSGDVAFPCANPLPQIISLAPRTILDLGCGSVLDALFCVSSLPKLQRLTGLDASPKLLAKGEELLRHFPAESEKITLHRADLNHLSSYQLETSELILMNGSFNLIYDKIVFFTELFPLLATGGTLLIYDFILTENLPPGFSNEVDNWLWNIGGALNAVELERVVNGAGLVLVEINQIERIDPVARCEIIISHPTKSG